MPQQSLSPTGMLASALAIPLRVARTTYAVLIHPRKFYSNIALGSPAGLKRAIWYYTLVLGSMTGIEFLLLRLLGLSIDLPDEQLGAKFLNTVRHSDTLSNVVTGLYFLLIALVSYWILQRKRIRGRIDFAQYLHSILYPMAAFSVVQTLFEIVLISAVLCVAVNYDAAASMPATVSDFYCKDPAGLQCKFALVWAQQRVMSAAVSVGNILLAIWMAVVIGVIINSKTGIGIGRIAFSFLAGGTLVNIALGFIVVVEYASRHAEQLNELIRLLESLWRE